MFMPTLDLQTTPAQREKWLSLAEQYLILGTYAQTELGHGTHLRGVETTATYDPSTETFDIHTPTLTATKWWPGGLGKTSNYVVLMANLITRGKSEGIHAFIVQIRDENTHEPLKGVTVGDIGPKFGYDMIDNGFLRFDHVRIPRDQMLMKNAQVLKDGTYNRAQTSKLSYGTMVFVRSMIVADVSGRGLAAACTIATRYSAVRHQSELKPGAPEPQVIDYQTQQFKLFPLIATAYAFLFTGFDLRDIYFRSNSEIQQGNVELLPELHALSSCLKAYTTAVTMSGIEQCRLACGGHGYSLASGIPKIYATCTPACTYEGENTVLHLQTARFLLKAFAQVGAGKKLSGSVAYLTEGIEKKCSVDEALDVRALVRAFKHRSHMMTMKVGEKYTRLLSKGHPDWEARNLCAVQLTKASAAHAQVFIVDNFAGEVEKQEDAPVRAVLATLFRLYAVYNITQEFGDFIEDGYVSSAQLDMLRERMLDLLAEVRPNAVALVDAFDFHDHLLSSVLGRYDGNVYENLYKWAQQAPLNKTQVHESYYKYIKPLQQEMKSKL